MEENKDKKISGLTEITELTGAEMFPVADSSPQGNGKVSAETIREFVQPDLTGYVKKEAGKRLMTDAEAQKLEKLEAYDDTELRGQVAANRRDIDLILGETDALGAIGFARANGDVSADAEVMFGNAERIRSVGRHFKTGVFKNGKLVKECAPGRITRSVGGSEIAIDGSEGDVMVYTDCDLYWLRDTRPYIPEGGTLKEYNIVAIGLAPFSIGGKEAKRVRPFAITPCDTVIAKLPGDLRECAHCVYNRDVEGTYTAPSGVLKASYKTGGRGYPTQYMDEVKNLKMAQAKNEDEHTVTPYMGMYYEFYEIWITMMSIELGTWAHTRLDLFGVGCTTKDMVSKANFADEAMTANSGWKVMAGEKTMFCYAFGKEEVKLNAESNASNLIAGVVGISNFGFCEVLEAQRVLDAIAKAGLTDKMGNIGCVFSFDGDGNLVCTEDGSVDLSTGEGMEVCRHYYVARGVPRCAGMAEGAMTAVVNSYTKMEFSDGTLWKDGTSLTGAVGILKRSMPLYRGFTLPLVGCVRHISYAYYVSRKDADGNVMPMLFKCCSDVSKVLPRTTYTYNVGVEELADMENGLDLVKECPDNSVSGWMKKADYRYSLIFANEIGGGSRQYENCYTLIQNLATEPRTRVVGSSCVGCYANINYASARTAILHRYSSYSPLEFVAAFAIASIGSTLQGAHPEKGDSPH